MELPARAWTREVDAPLVRVARVAWLAGFALFLVPLGPPLATIFASSIGTVSMVLGAAILALCGVVVVVGRRFRRRVTSSIAVRDGALLIDGRVYADRGSLAFGGTLVGADGAQRVVIFRRRRVPWGEPIRPLVLLSDDHAANEALLRALELERSTQRMELATLRGMHIGHVLFGALLYFLLIIPLLGASIVMLPSLDPTFLARLPGVVFFGPIHLVSFLACGAAFGLAWKTLRIGQDGIAIDRLFSRTFIPFRDITCVARVGRKLRVELRDGSVVPLLELAPLGRRGGDETCDLLVARIRAELDRPRTAPTRCVELARGARSIPSWLDAARAHGAGVGGYREGTLSHELLERQLDDADADPALRIAAALALRTADPAFAPRILSTAKTTGATPLRHALEAAAADPMSSRLPAIAAAAISS